jgi:hypothetical protein
VQPLLLDINELKSRITTAIETIGRNMLERALQTRHLLSQEWAHI